MKFNSGWGRKDMGDLKRDIKDTANTSKEIMQDKLYDIKKGAQNSVNEADKDIKSFGRKSQNIATDIKKGSAKAWKNIQKTASNIARTFTSSRKR